jgi:transposase-like protein
MGTIHSRWASSRASAIWAGVAPLPSAIRPSKSKSQVSVMAAELDELVASFRSRPSRTFWVRASNADGRREIPGLDVASSEDGAGWLAFLRGLAPAACPASSW